MTELRGRIIEVGNIECLQDESGVPRSGILIQTSETALRDCPRNLAYAEVVIRFADEVEAKKEPKP